MQCAAAEGCAAAEHCADRKLNLLRPDVNTGFHINQVIVDLADICCCLYTDPACAQSCVNQVDQNAAGCRTHGNNPLGCGKRLKRDVVALVNTDKTAPAR